MEELYQLLAQDSELKSLLSATKKDNRIYPLHSEKGDKSITWNYITLTSDRMKEQARFEVRVFVKDILLGNQILQRVKEILLTFGDEELTENILNVQVNGGITPLLDNDSGLYTIGLFFTILKRY